MAEEATSTRRRQQLLQPSKQAEEPPAKKSKPSEEVSDQPEEIIHCLRGCSRTADGSRQFLVHWDETKYGSGSKYDSWEPEAMLPPKMVRAYIKSNKTAKYAVERLCGRRVRNGVVEYKVKWTGYEGEDTWEPESAMTEESIQRYNALSPVPPPPHGLVPGYGASHSDSPGPLPRALPPPQL